MSDHHSPQSNQETLLQKFEVGYVSDVGRVRKNNEDAIYVDSTRGVFAVSDGMGGHRRGDLASKITIETLERSFASYAPIDVVIRAAHEKIYSESISNPDATRMGATVVLARVQGRELEVGWVGDSRAYLWDQTQLAQISKDHTYVQELVDAGMISEEEALYHPKKHLLTSALGVSSEHELLVGRSVLRMSVHDTLLLCSDGLTTDLSESQVISVLQQQELTNQDKAELLVQLTNDAGGRDNTSVILLGFDLNSEEGSPAVDLNGMTQASKAASK